MEEIWKPVVGYEVSNLGKVRSIDRIIVNNLGISKSLKGKILKESYPSTTDAGKKLGLPQNSISRACLSDSLYKGYIWSYNNLNVKP